MARTHYHTTSVLSAAPRLPTPAAAACVQTNGYARL